MNADILIKNGIVLTMNDHGAVVDKGAVAVKDSLIAWIGPDDQTGEIQAAKVLDAEGGIIMPGLINAHTHASMTCFRGLADDLPLMTWLNDHIFPAEAKLTEDMVYKGALLACAEMILSGTTSFCDMYLFEGAVAKAAHDSGMRAVVGEVLYDFPSPNYGPLENGFAYTRDLLEEYKGHDRVRIAVEPHSPYLCAPDLLKKAREIAEEWNAPLVIHASESENEVAQIKEKYGCTPMEHLAKIGFLCPRLMADHCVVLTDNDISLLADNKVKAVHNPESNMKLASGIAPVPALLEAGVCVSLGTDGCASNNNLDMMAEMNAAAKIHKAAALDPTVMDAKTVLTMATKNGASALGMDGQCGVMEQGKLADIIILDVNRPHLVPMYNPMSHVVYSARGGDVRHSIIHGKLVMEDRRVLTIDIKQAMAHVRELAKTIA
ncbi:amidohydrolase [Desulfatibacillum aliphaticivorans]|uniref:5-methylthioadenosine/S-adenosylhomocysteine deaminase n=1 Tax=Desulfatibacillum aliphaticivorans TaxID=218208 RepID=B8FDQ4_DESAL|nr:amidohydrolase [Desulfatibacillum aliphaticivorans]ACL06685.1 amidohydrolase [Desulfatibacillum aliphaticivorans]